MKRRYWKVPTSTKSTLLVTARQLRQNPTASQHLLWQALRGKELGVRVRREQPIGPYIVDFYIAATKLIIEIDGPIHETQKLADAERQSNLENLGYRFLRITAEDVVTNLPKVLQAIRQAIILDK